MNTPRESRREWLYILVGAVFVVVLVMLLYLPVASAWSSRISGTGFQEREPSVAYVVVERNWPMRHLPFLYDPLMQFYAGSNGWKLFGYKKFTAFPNPEVISLVFARDISSP